MAGNRLLPYLAFSTCCLIWGSTFLFIGLSNLVLPPLWGLTLRLTIGAIVLSAMMAATKTPIPRAAAFRAAAGFGFFDFAISLTLLYFGETKVPSGLAAVLYGSAPVLSMLMESLLGMERLSWLKLTAAIVAIGGVAVIFWQQIAFGSSAWGILAVLAAVLTGVISALFLKRGPQQSPVGVNAVGALVSIPFTLGMSFLLREPHVLPTSSAQLIPLLYLGIVGSAGAFVVFAWLLGRWSISSASFVAVVIPVIAVTLGVLVRGEKFPPGSLVGALVVMVATAIVLRLESKGAASRA